MSEKVKARLYVENDLEAGVEITLDGAQGNYMVTVMRCRTGDFILLFNGREGEWLAEISKAGEGKACIKILQIVAAQKPEPDLWYLFAPLKKARTDYMIEKATELGVSLIRPVRTERTNLKGFKAGRLRLHAIEAAEQCERFTVPVVEPLIKLADLLGNWPRDRLMMFCDEEGDQDQNTYAVGRAMDEVDAWQGAPEKWAILIGPEGGFSEDERQLIRKQAFVVPVTLGPRILRADTAAIAAITLWQSFVGDWQE